MGDDQRTIRLTRTRLLAGALTVVLLAGGAGLAGAQVGEATFSDTDDPAVDVMTDAGCMQGYADGTFRPQWKVTRLGLAGMLHDCVGRAGFAEAARQLRSTGSPSLLHLRVAGPESDQSTGGFFTFTATIELTAEGSLTAPCRVRFSLANGEPGNGDEQAVVDIPVDDGRTVQNLNATMVEQVHTHPGFRTGSEVVESLYGVIEGSCSATLTAEVAMTGVYTPLDGLGRAAG